MQEPVQLLATHIHFFFLFLPSQAAPQTPQPQIWRAGLSLQKPEMRTAYRKRHYKPPKQPAAPCYDRGAHSWIVCNMSPGRTVNAGVAAQRAWPCDSVERPRLMQVRRMRKRTRRPHSTASAPAASISRAAAAAAACKPRSTEQLRWEWRRTV